MENRVRIRALQRLSDRACKIGFRQTHLRLDGLREHIQQFNNSDVQNQLNKAKWIIKNLKYSKKAIQMEIYDNDAPGYYYWRKEVEFRKDTVFGVIMNSVAGVFIAAQILNVHNGDNRGVIFGSLIFVGTFIHMLHNTIKNRFSNYANFRNRIENTIFEIEKSFQKYVSRDHG